MTDFETMPTGTKGKIEELERKLFERNLSEIKRLVGSMAETLRYNTPYELVRLQQILKEIE